ncbi:hypothetical protein ACOMHN_055101 [Nucella lapillus]
MAILSVHRRGKISIGHPPVLAEVDLDLQRALGYHRDPSVADHGVLPQPSTQERPLPPLPLRKHDPLLRAFRRHRLHHEVADLCGSVGVPAVLGWGWQHTLPQRSPSPSQAGHQWTPLRPPGTNHRPKPQALYILHSRPSLSRQGSVPPLLGFCVPLTRPLDHNGHTWMMLPQPACPLRHLRSEHYTRASLRGGARHLLLQQSPVTRRIRMEPRVRLGPRLAEWLRPPAPRSVCRLSHRAGPPGHLRLCLQGRPGLRGLCLQGPPSCWRPSGTGCLTNRHNFQSVSPTDWR